MRSGVPDEYRLASHGHQVAIHDSTNFPCGETCAIYDKLRRTILVERYGILFIIRQPYKEMASNSELVC